MATDPSSLVIYLKPEIALSYCQYYPRCLENIVVLLSEPHELVLLWHQVIYLLSIFHHQTNSGSWMDTELHMQIENQCRDAPTCTCTKNEIGKQLSVHACICTCNQLQNTLLRSYMLNYLKHWRISCTRR